MSDRATPAASEDRPFDVDVPTGIRRRFRLVLVALVTVGVGLAVSTLLSGFVADAVADALYTVLVYLLVAAAVLRLSPIVVGCAAFAVSAVIEFSQLTGIPAALAVVFPPARLVFGTTFVATDLIFYAIGATAVAGIDGLVRRRSRRLQGRRGGTSRRP
ncbi:DUF2809 domain-containing protein [Mycetocola zhadangensis]|uniref:ribosomal maturation YjgA family protein n=1 Tax=Mycetocola zhadangensis TaxID=1164595 RepID=UPI001601B863|nr:DUF2809 domain-containing protein [Mycetocola zhadangensis]GGE88892.1 hypothetical protein GCM10011313_09480 [Mycetocola zhadangensis]